MHDFFVGAMTCPSCGTTSDATSVTNMQTHLRDDARGIELPAGFDLHPAEVTTASVADAGYLRVAPARNGRMLLLDTWTCPTCGHENWARVTIDGTRIERVEGIVLDRTTLAEAQFIADEAALATAARLTDQSSNALWERREQIVPTLLARLS
jgi:hypothetical protein